MPAAGLSAKGRGSRQHQHLLRRNECDRLLRGNGVNMAKTNAERQAEYRARMRATDGERLSVVISAEAKQANVQADTATQAASADPDDRGDAIQDRAGAAYKTAMAKAEGDYKVAKEGCESAKGDAQAACKKSAEAAYEAAKSNALVVRDAERKRGDAVQKLDN